MRLMVVLKKQDLPRSDETRVFKLLQNLPEVYKTENVEKAFSFLTSLIKNSKLGVRMVRMREEWISI